MTSRIQYMQRTAELKDDKREESSSEVLALHSVYALRRKSVIRQAVQAAYNEELGLEEALWRRAQAFANAELLHGITRDRATEVIFDAVKGGLEIPAEAGSDAIIIANAAVLVHLDDGK